MQRVNVEDFLFSCYYAEYKDPSKVFSLSMAQESLSVCIYFMRMILKTSLWMPIFTQMNSDSGVLQHMMACLSKPGRGNRLTSVTIHICLETRLYWDTHSITTLKELLLWSKSVLYSSHYLHIQVPSDTWKQHRSPSLSQVEMSFPRWWNPAAFFTSFPLSAKGTGLFSTASGKGMTQTGLFQLGCPVLSSFQTLRPFSSQVFL